MSWPSPSETPLPAGSAVSDIVVATTNAGKLAELKALLNPYVVNCRPVTLWRADPVDEDGITYLENAERKAVAAAKTTGLMALSDDSGLEIDALHGRPGVSTARWTKSRGGEENARQALRQLLERLGFDPRACGARAVSALCLATPDGRVLLAEGSRRGYLTWPPRTRDRALLGMFIPEGHCVSLAEVMERELAGPLSDAEASHRGLAFRDLLALGAARILRPEPSRDRSTAQAYQALDERE